MSSFPEGVEGVGEVGVDCSFYQMVREKEGDPTVEPF